MASWTLLPSSLGRRERPLVEGGSRAILTIIVLALAFVILTRWPVARAVPLETDEFGFLGEVAAQWFPRHHTLFKTFGRLCGLLAGDAYRGFIVLDMITSALALVAAWWWLRALVSPTTAMAAALMLGVGPDFWGYGAVAGNYTAIVLVGSFLMGVCIRGHHAPERWHPHAAAIVLAVGTGYRSDIGLFWLPVFVVILWQHRWKAAILAGIVFVVTNLAWAIPMLVEAGGWQRYRESSAEFAYNAGVLNSAWNLGLIDGPVRYAVKIGMALICTLGPALIFAPRGSARLRRVASGGFLGFLVLLSVLPALATHLVLHFGVPGYAFHYLPGLMAMIVLGIGRTVPDPDAREADEVTFADDQSVPRLLGLATVLAAVFLFYPTNFSAPGWRGDFDLAFLRLTRNGLNAPIPRSPAPWRTANSRVAIRESEPGDGRDDPIVALPGRSR